MKIPKIIFSDNFLNAISWFMSIGGITIWPFVILREKYRDDPRYADYLKTTINHESIHIKQQQELLVIPFYILYVIEWFIKLFIYGRNSYRNISFEREVYSNAENQEYLKTRKIWAFFKYIFRK